MPAATAIQRRHSDLASAGGVARRGRGSIVLLFTGILPYTVCGLFAYAYVAHARTFLSLNLVIKCSERCAKFNYSLCSYSFAFHSEHYRCFFINYNRDQTVDPKWHSK